MGNGKVVIYGVGKIFDTFKQRVIWDDVVAVVDSNVNMLGEIVEGFVIQSPQDIPNLSYDYIVIFTERYFPEVRDILIGEYFVEQEKIVSFMYFFEEKKYWTYEARNLILDCIDKENVSVLDTDEIGLAIYDINRWNVKSSLYKSVSTKFPLLSTYYDDYLAQPSFEPDVLMLWDDYSKNVDSERIKQYKSGKILWVISHSYKRNPLFEKQLNNLNDGRKRKIFIFKNEIIYIFSSEENKRSEIDCKVYVVCHKKYNCVTNDMYKTIGVGSDRSLDTSFYDDTGVNIAHLNPYINECTAIYWAWKNTNSEYVGINHYRRYFYNTSVKQRDNVLSKEKIQDIFQNEKVDIILSEMKNLKVSLFENICNSVDDRSLCEMALKCVKKVMYQRVPEYMDAFEYVMKGNSFYKCNVFVTRRDIFEQYCSWLFSFITDVAEEFDVSSYGKKQKRVIGYFAEGMLSVWLLKQTLRIKELPLSETIGNDV